MGGTAHLTERVHIADGDTGVLTGTALTTAHTQTANKTAQRTGKVAVGQVLYLVNRHRGNRTGKVGFLLGAVTYHHHFFKVVLVFLELKLAAGSHCHGLIADIGDDYFLAFGN